MSYSGSGRVMNMLKSEKSLKRTNSWSLWVRCVCVWSCVYVCVCACS